MSTNTTGDTMDFAGAADVVARMRGEIARALIGQPQAIDHVLVALIAAGHVLVEGVPGMGKTLLVRALARTFGGRFARIQFTPDLMPSDVTGHALYDLRTQEFKIRKGPVFTHLLLADEINRAPAKTQSALLEAMQEQQVSIEGQPFAMDRPFMVLATQNPIEQEGTYPLPEAQLDRFLLKVLIDYPRVEDERALVRQVTENRSGDSLQVDDLATVIAPEQVTQLQQVAARIAVDSAVLDYAVDIVRATREHGGISIGAGPRGGIALVRAARARALLDGRDFVTPDDVKDIALPALRHRIALAPELDMEGLGVDAVLNRVLAGVNAPRR
ncbi:MAG: AAA family ATPase [Gammaproteobacteria bacterium]